MRERPRKKLRAVRSVPLPAPSRPNECWAMDFVHDYLADGRRVRTLNVVDACTRECLAIEVDTSLAGGRVVRVLAVFLSSISMPMGHVDPPAPT